MKFFIALFLAFTISGQAYAIPVKVERRDLKLATQRLVERDAFTAPEAADADQLLDDQATSSSSTTSVTSFLAQPDVCRALSITPGGTTADVAAGDIVISGFNTLGRAVTETFTLSANESSQQDGSKAFCSVSSVLFPVQDGDGATYDVGVIEKLGVKRCLDSAGSVIQATLNGVKESTDPTTTFDADEAEKNLIDLNSTLNGNDVIVYYIQNNQCY